MAIRVFVAALSVFFLLILYIFFLGLFAGPSSLPPDFDLFIGLYFQDLLLPQIFVLVVWYISMQKTNMTRLYEYKFLVSLPLTGKEIFAKFFVNALIRYAWVPTAFAFLYVGLLPLASYRFLARPMLFSFVSYLFLYCLIVVTDLLAIKRVGVFRAFNYLIKHNPAIIALAGILYEAAQVLFIFAAKELSAMQFALTNLVIVSLSLLAASRAGNLFRWLHDTNFWHKNWGLEQAQTAAQGSRGEFSAWVDSRIKNPFLYKNIILLLRSKSKLVNSSLTVAFFMVAYLLAMNNITHSDALDVLFGFTVFFVLLYNLASINRFNRHEEAAEILFSLPVTKSGLYLSILIPIGAWLLTVVSLLTGWLWLKDFAITQLWSFWLNAFLAILVALTISLNCALGHYPNLKTAQNRYAFWFFFMILSSTIFYEFRILIALITCLVTFMELRKLKFFQIC